MDVNKSKFLILVYLPMEWHQYHRRPLWLAIAELNNVLVIEPPAGILTAGLHPDRLAKYISSKMRIRRGEAGIYFFRPLSLVSYGVGFRLPWLAYLDRTFLSVQLRYAVRSSGYQFDNLITFVVTALQYYVTDIIPSDLRCYEITDEYSVDIVQHKIDLNNSFTLRIIKNEQKIISMVDVIFTSSQVLHDRKCKNKPNSYFLPNSADFNHFSKALKPEMEVPNDLKSIPRPRIGYVGSINEVFDLELLNTIAHTQPDLSIVLIGKINGSRKFIKSSSFQTLLSQPNVHYLGYQNYSSLPSYLKGLDVCLLPNRLSVWVENSFPNKIFQYLSAGKPVVATDFPAVRTVKEEVYIAKDSKEFIHLIKQALVEDNNKKVENRMKIGELNSTKVRAGQMLQILYKLIKERADKKLLNLKNTLKQ